MQKFTSYICFLVMIVQLELSILHNRKDKSVVRMFLCAKTKQNKREQFGHKGSTSPKDVKSRNLETKLMFGPTPKNFRYLYYRFFPHYVYHSKKWFSFSNLQIPNITVNCRKRPTCGTWICAFVYSQTWKPWIKRDNRYF